MNEALHQHQAALLTGLSSRLVPELKRYLQHHGEGVVQFIKGYGEEAGAAAAVRHAQTIDGLLSSLFHAVTAAMPGAAPFALGAVGSYGRATLSVYSDLDVRVLCASEPEASAPIVEALLYPLWDVGLNIGHQVVPLDEVVEMARADLPTATSMLDWRHLAGSRELSEQLLARCYSAVFGPDDIGAFLQKLQQASYARKERYGASVFLLEPDLKNGSGGLRDVDLAHWAARARWRVRKLEELVGLGVLLPDEWRDFQEANEFLMRLRNVLHLVKKRKVDRIGFEEQEMLAKVFNYGTGGQGAEAFMSDYYRQARIVELTSEMILRRAMPPPKVKPQEVLLGDGTKTVGDAVAIEDEDALFLEPWLAFLVFSHAVKRELKVAEPTRRAISRAVASEAFQARLRTDKRSIDLFRQLVCEPKETRFRFGSVLTELHEVGLLLAMIPEFLPVVGRVHHDIYHVYTVDIHSIAAVDKQRSVFRGVEAKALPLATKIVRSCERREVVFFATLLHDVGKDAGGRQHAARGAELARQILARLQFEPEAIEAVAKLIDIHLKMYLYATRRDIDDIRTLESFSQAVVDEEGLRELYLLTIADVATTSPTSLNPWKLKMLDDLYAATNRYLVDGKLRRVASDNLVQTIREQAPASVPTDLIEAFLHSIPTRYLTAFEPDAVVEHLKLAVGAREGTTLAVTRRSPPHAEICVIGDDEPGFLAKVCAVFAHAKVKVVSAQIHSWQDASGRRRALDSFWVRDPSETNGVAARIPELDRRLRQVVSGEVAALDLVGPPRHSVGVSQRPAPAVPIQVRIDNEGATDRTIVEVITKDQLGLLFWISETIFECGLSIDLAKIHTEGARVTDVFYVTTEEHRQLLDSNRLAHLRQRLTDQLKRLEDKSNS